ncbi:tetratricopeptide repeat protein [Iningainema tapete]|uniref:Tetratricopeptide repeat protein n=1 Tax=Iningainema tapete BLCC-T55 TaxID=2748662 RepID=A0A8J6XUM0_9CYAN|nr:tetratricopeptide repeat protein [Iningainema tapete]MBD2778864.1 tetratricopeptide repeat protein [Iningainema tapete BLCC-T55]
MIRFILNFGITVVLACVFLISPALSSPAPSNQITASDFFKLGVEKILEGNYQAAVEDFTQALAIKNNFVAAYSNRCLAYIQLEEYQNASLLRRSFANADCNMAINFAPDKADTYLNRGLAYYRLGDYLAAIADHNQAIALNKSDFRAYYNRGVAFAMLGNHQQAIGDYNLALSQIPQNPSHQLADIYNDRGIARLELRDLPAAMGDFTRAIRFNPQDYRGYFNRACVCARNGDNRNAISDFTASLKLHPINAQAYFNRGVAYHRLGYEQAAISDLQKAAQYFASTGETLQHEKTLDLVKNIQQQLPYLTEIALTKILNHS